MKIHRSKDWQIFSYMKHIFQKRFQLNPDKKNNGMWRHSERPYWNFSFGFPILSNEILNNFSYYFFQRSLLISFFLSKPKNEVQNCAKVCEKERQIECWKLIIRLMIFFSFGFELKPRVLRLNCVIKSFFEDCFQVFSFGSELKLRVLRLNNVIKSFFEFCFQLTL